MPFFSHRTLSAFAETPCQLLTRHRDVTVVIRPSFWGEEYVSVSAPGQSGSVREAKGNHDIAQREIEQFVSTGGNGDKLLPIHRIRHGRSIHSSACVKVP